jgi:hypothetical protein
MRIHRLSWAIAVLGALLLTACSGGKGSPAPGNSLSISATDGTGATTTFTANDSNAIITAHKSVAENKTFIQVCADVDADNDCSHLFVVTIDGTTAQTYSMATPDAVTQVVYHDDETETGVLSHYRSGDGAIQVTELGSSAGEAVKGTFDTTLTCNSGCSGNLAVSGSFSVALTQ